MQQVIDYFQRNKIEIPGCHFKKDFGRARSVAERISQKDKVRIKQAMGIQDYRNSLEWQNLELEKFAGFSNEKNSKQSLSV